MNRVGSPEAEPLETFTSLESPNQIDTCDSLNKHYRAFLNDEFSSPPPTPKDATERAKPTRRSSEAAKKMRVVKIPSKKRAPREDGLTAEELALDPSSDEDPIIATPATQRAGAPRPALSRRSLNPLPSIDPSTVHSKEHKHALANALQQGNDAKIQLLTEATKWRQQFEAERMRVDLEARNSALTWDKERYFLDRQELREAESRQAAQASQKERKAFCQQLVMDGKTPQELEAFLRLVYPNDQA